MSEVIIKVQCDHYLVKFLEAYFNSSPVRFPRNNNFRNFLEIFLDFPPLDHRESDYGRNTLTVELPFFEDKDPRSYNFLNPIRQRIFVDHIWMFFKITFRSEINKYRLTGIGRNDAISLFMDKYNIPDECWESLLKDYSRYLQNHSKKKYRKNRKHAI